MVGNILKAARADAKRYTSSGGFEDDITIKTPDGSTTVNIKGSATKHHISFDTDGNQVNSKNAHIRIVEDDLVALGYPVRNASGEGNLRNHLVSVPDSTLVIRNYIITETFPNETMGVIVCILGDYNM